MENGNHKNGNGAKISANGKFPTNGNSTSQHEKRNGSKKLPWKVGLVGLGKLGMPVSLAISYKGHDVMGFDVNPEQMQKERFPHREIGPNGEPSIEPLLQKSSIKF